MAPGVPFSVYDVERDLRMVAPTWSSHEQAEFKYIVRGNLELYFGNQKYSVRPGDVVVIPPNKLHLIRPLDAGNFSYTVLMLHSDIREALYRRGGEHLLDFFSCAVNHPVLCADESWSTWLSLLFRRLLEETGKQERYSDNCAFDLVELIIAETARQYRDIPAMEVELQYEKPDISRLIKNVIQYIYQNFREDINLSRIAREFWLNPSYLSRQFKYYVGMNITEFIMRQRLDYAKIQLTITDKSISEIALETGYNNISYFNTVFKNQVGISPKQYRRDQQRPVSDRESPAD